MSLLLTPNELQALTGTKQPKRQAAPDASWMLAPGLGAERKAEGVRRLAEVRAQKTANPAPVPPQVAEHRRESRAALVRHHEGKRRATHPQHSTPRPAQSQHTGCAPGASGTHGTAAKGQSRRPTPIFIGVTK